MAETTQQIQFEIVKSGLLKSGFKYRENNDGEVGYWHPVEDKTFFWVTKGEIMSSLEWDRITPSGLLGRIEQHLKERVPDFKMVL